MTRVQPLALSIRLNLDDCDKVLRIEGEHLTLEHLKIIVNENGFICEVLD
jgi:hypothetical protein